MTRTRAVVGMMTLVACLTAAGCSKEYAPALAEIRRVRAGTLDVVVLSAHPGIKPGKDTFFLEFRAADGKLVDVGDVAATATMPMPGMAPMVADTQVRKTEIPGRYAVAANTAMVGDWRLAVEWKGAAGAGSASVVLAIQA